MPQKIGGDLQAQGLRAAQNEDFVDDHPDAQLGFRDCVASVANVGQAPGGVPPASPGSATGEEE